ncbi:NERD domain-containing protein [Clostridium sp.]|uniref:NERD domain-containing protein n=1 Tax=Clostridium sp. TaxID=1506 RepID=UPI002FC6E9B2
MENKINPNLLSDDEMLKILKEEYEELKPKGCWDFFSRRKRSPSLPYLKKRFGVPFNKILLKAGINEKELNFVRRDKEEYTKIIKNLYKKLGHTPSAQEFIANGYSTAILSKIFGSYNNAMRECGLEPNKYQSKVNESKKELLKIYKDISNKIGKPASEDELNSFEGVYSATVFSLRFGGMNNLRKIAGFEEAHGGNKPKYSKEIITETLIEEYYKLKRHLTKLEIEKNERLPSYITILKYFAVLKIADVWAEIDKIIIEREVLCNKSFSSEDKQYSHTSETEIINAGTIGEKKVSHYLSFLNYNKYKVYNNIAVKSNGRYQQIDHLVIGPNGLFHIETKNYSGEIYVDRNENWSKTTKYKYELLENPKGQIQRHEEILKEIVGDKFEIVSILAMAHKYCRLSGLENTTLNLMKVECVLDFITSYEGQSYISKAQATKIINVLEKSIETADTKVI